VLQKWSKAIGKWIAGGSLESSVCSGAWFVANRRFPLLRPRPKAFRVILFWGRQYVFCPNEKKAKRQDRKKKRCSVQPKGAEQPMSSCFQKRKKVPAELWSANEYYKKAAVCCIVSLPV
jgi:hypothetical protein